MSTLRETFLQELADLYDAEKQITKALPKMAKAAEHDELKDMFETHLEETERQIQRLEEVFEKMGSKAKAKKCMGMQGLLKEGEELIKEDEGDAALIAAAQKVEHYEIAAYGSLAAWAKLMNETEIADLLDETMQEEKSTDEKLTEVAESAINVEENQAKGEEEEQPSRSRSRSKATARNR